MIRCISLFLIRTLAFQFIQDDLTHTHALWSDFYIFIRLDVFSLEEALEYIKADEYVEVTPKSMRMRKVILDELERKRANKE